MGITLKSIAQEQTAGLTDLFIGREPLKKKDRKSFLGIKLTVSDFDTVDYSNKHYAVIVFEERPNVAYSAGKSLTDIIDAYAEACGGIREARALYAEETEPLVVMLEETETEDGKTFIKTSVVDDEKEGYAE